MAKKLKVGDKVLYRKFISNGSVIPTIKDFKVEQVKVPYTDKYITLDVTLDFDGKPYRTSLDKIYKPDQRTLDIENKYRWEVAGVKERNGYFGSYSLIERDGKQAVVFCDDSDALVKVVTDWYDKIIYDPKLGMSWSGDYRWNHDMPIIVYQKRKGYNLNLPHCNVLLCDEWLKSIEPKWRMDNTIGSYIKGVNKQGQEVIISDKGRIQLASLANPKNIEVVMKSVKSFTKDEVLHLWIEKGLPCAHIRGLEFKGAHYGFINTEEAKKLYQTHTNFNEPFNSVEWRVLDNQVTLLFRDYCNSDYD